MMSTAEDGATGGLSHVPGLRQRVADLRASLEAATGSDSHGEAEGSWLAARDNVRSALQDIEPADLFAGLDDDMPLALLPVRLETRFSNEEGAENVLHVRIFPDDVHIDGHDAELTAAENELGNALWVAPNDLPADGETASADSPVDDSAGRRARWAALVTLLGGPRAAWVAQRTRPGSSEPIVKSAAYVRPSVARLLPDRWLVRADVEGTVVDAWTGPVGVDLHMAPDPAATDPGISDATDGSPSPVVDSQMAWLVDYQAAVAAGMAVDLPLPDGTDVVENLVAVGVRASSSPTDSATELASLLTAHRYSDGLGFLAPGSPTANTPLQRSRGDRHVDPDLLWQLEFGAPSPTGAAHDQLVEALGLAAGVLSGLDGGSDATDSNARAMATAIWAGTWGYFLSHLVDSSELSALDLDAVRAFALANVRGCGSLPTLRVGRQPYGVLPILPLARWAVDDAGPVVDGLAKLLQQVRPLWEFGIRPTVSASVGPHLDEAFTRIMSTDATARAFQIRSVLGDITFDPGIFCGLDVSTGHAVIDAILGHLLALESNPVIFRTLSPHAEPVRAPLVVDPSDPNGDASVRAMIASLIAANPLDSLVRPHPPWQGKPSQPVSVLHTLLWRSLLTEYSDAASRLFVFLQSQRSGSAAPVVPHLAPGLPAGMLSGLSPDPGGGFTPIVSPPHILSQSLPGVLPGHMGVGEWLWRNPSMYPQLRGALSDSLAALGQLATLSVEELSLHLSGTLDVAMHRWTAWAEGIAKEKLSRLRQKDPTGLTVGAWSFVGQISRRTRAAVDPGESAGASSGPVWQDERPGGFVHAPSTAQAATAAVLRSAHLAHGGEDEPTFAIDLSSAQARAAVRLAEGVNSGQALGAQLGYELELELHGRGANALIAPLRAFAPAWKASGTFVEGEPEEIVSPSAVVDGLAVVSADPAAVVGAVGAVGGQEAALLAAMDRVRARQDAYADLLTAEMVHQTLLGNVTRAKAVLDAMNRGGRPPTEFDVLRTPRTGVSLTCRVGVLLPSPEAADLSGGWPQTTRGLADPAVASWLSTVLPPVSRVRFQVTNPDGTVADATLPTNAGLGPLDLVLEEPEVILSRLRLALAPAVPTPTGHDPSWTPDVVSLGELLTVAAELREVAAGRPLQSAHLAVSDPAEAIADREDLSARVAAVRSALAEVSTLIRDATAKLSGSLGSVSAAMRAASIDSIMHAINCGIPVVLDHSPDDTELLRALKSCASELDRRNGVPAPEADAPAEALTDALKTLLGKGQPGIPVITLAADYSAGLLAGDGYLASDPELACDWLQDAAAVRAGVGKLASAVQDCEALSATTGEPLAGTWRIVECGPPSGRWSATLNCAEITPLNPPATAVLHAAAGARLSPGARVSGLICDEWVEVIPQPVAATTVAYQAEAPSARAPQAVLLGVCPDQAAGWTVDSVVDLVREAFSWAQLRTVDHETSAWIGRMLPAVALPDGDVHDVVSAPSSWLTRVDPAVLRSNLALSKGLG
jgi:hypothetical protein